MKHLYRFTQASFGPSPWVLIPAAPDKRLASKGKSLAGPVYDLSLLSDAERQSLLALLRQRKKTQTPDQMEQEKALLERCPRRLILPPLDVDVCQDSREYDPDHARQLASQYRDALDKAAADKGLGDIEWWETNDHGGSHGHLAASKLPPHPDLLRMVHALICEVAKAADVPLLTELPHGKENRPAVYLDDTLFLRKPDSRGVMWRLPWTRKPGRISHQKRPIENELSTATRRVIDRAAVQSAVERRDVVRARSRMAGVANSPSKKPARQRQGQLKRPSGKLAGSEKEMLKESKKLRLIWNNVSAGKDGKVDRSKRDCWFAVCALEAGATDQQTINLLYRLPGGKASSDNRELAYVMDVLSWAYDRIARREKKKVSVLPCSTLSLQGNTDKPESRYDSGHLGEDHLEWSMHERRIAYYATESEAFERPRCNVVLVLRNKEKRANHMLWHPTCGMAGCGYCGPRRKAAWEVNLIDHCKAALAAGKQIRIITGPKCSWESIRKKLVRCESRDYARLWSAADQLFILTTAETDLGVLVNPPDGDVISEIEEELVEALKGLPFDHRRISTSRTWKLPAPDKDEESKWEKVAQTARDFDDLAKQVRTLPEVKTVKTPGTVDLGKGKLAFTLSFTIDPQVADGDSYAEFIERLTSAPAPILNFDNYYARSKQQRQQQEKQHAPQGSLF